jgi:hypothetical protein
MRKNGARGQGARWKGVRRRALLTVCVAAVLVFGAVGGSIAWLVDSTDTVTNTFTAGDINIALAETQSAFKMVPGNEIAKDPTVTVKAGSEKCWLFVKVVGSDSLDEFIEWEIAPDWLALKGHPRVFYREVEESDADQHFAVLGYRKTGAGALFVQNKVLVKDTVTKENLEALSEAGATMPTLKVTAYAVQWDNIPNALAAWSKIVE